MSTAVLAPEAPSGPMPPAEPDLPFVIEFEERVQLEADAGGTVVIDAQGERRLLTPMMTVQLTYDTVDVIESTIIPPEGDLDVLYD